MTSFIFTKSKDRKGYSPCFLSGKHKVALFLTIALLLFGAFQVPANAATICVNPVGADGCRAKISDAVAFAASNSEADTIVVHPGRYYESGAINITESGLKILGDDPSTTTVIHEPSVIGQNVFNIAANSAEIAGLTITGNGHGIQINSGSATIHHNHIVNNKFYGINTGGNTQATVFNNVIVSNVGIGISGSGGYEGNKLVYNNIVANNVGGGIANSLANYNSSYGNSAWNYTSNASGIGNISQDCLFMNQAGGDYRLNTNSPCRDTGNPSYFDMDGTRSDMGSFGGPLAATIWPYGNVGPVITDLTVAPFYVPKGGTLSITATGQIR